MLRNGWSKATNARLLLGIVVAVATLGSIALAASAGTVSIAGLVIDEETGAPLSATVIAYRNSGADAWEFEDSALTDVIEGGAYVLEDLPAGTYRLCFEAYGRRTEYWNDAMTLESADDLVYDGATALTSVDAVLAPGVVSVTGVVTEAGSTEPTQAVVTAYVEREGSWIPVHMAHVDQESGGYALINLPADTYRIGFSAPEHAPQFWDGADEVDDASDVVFNGTDTVSGVDAALVLLPEAISGTVYDGSDGEGLVRTDVRAYELEATTGWVSVGEASTDASGTYTLRLAGGTYRLEFVRDRYLSEFYDDVADVSDAADVVFDGVSVVAGVDATMAPIPVAIAGAVSEESTTTPPPDMYVEAYSSDGEGEWEIAAGAYLDITGRYELRLPAGTYRVGFHNIDYQEEYYDDVADLADARDIVFDGENVVRGVDATVTPVPVAIKGTVLDDSSGEPISGATVDAYQLVSGDDYLLPDDEQWVRVAGARTGPRGEFSVRRSAGTYRLEISALGYASECYNNAASIEVAQDLVYDGATAVGPLTVRMAPTPSIKGKVIDDVTGNPIRDAQVTAYVPLADGQWASVDAATTNSSGFFSLHLQPGAYNLGFGHERSDGEYWNDAQELDTSAVVLVDGLTTVELGNVGLVMREEPDEPDEPDDKLPLTPGAHAIEGADRFATAVEVSKASFPDGAEAAVIATGRNWPDALGGAALAGAVNGPILLVEAGAVPAVVSSELSRLGAQKTYVLGGTSAVSEDVASALRNAGLSVTRLGGADRYETAKLVAAEAVARLGAEFDGTAFCATGANFPDALAGSPLSAGLGWPIVLLPPGGSAPATEMKSLGVTRVRILGGETVVSPTQEEQLRGAFGPGNVLRLAGADRYATAAAVAGHGVAAEGLSYDGVCLATGANFPDALAGGVLAGRHGTVMLLTRTEALPSAASYALSANKNDITAWHFLGGAVAISQSVRDEVARLLE